MLQKKTAKHFLTHDSDSEDGTGIFVSDEAPLSSLRFTKLIAYMKVLVSQWFPMAISSVLYEIPFAINFFLLSGYEDSDLTLGSMIVAISWVNCLCLLILRSINSSMDNVLLEFRRNHIRIERAVYYQAVLIIGSAYLIPSLIVIYFLGDVVNVTVAQYDQIYMGLITEYLRCALPAIAFAFYFEVFQVMNISIDHMNFPIILQMISVFLHLLINLFIMKYNTRIKLTHVTWTKNLSDFLSLAFFIFTLYPLKLIQKICDRKNLREAVKNIVPFFQNSLKQILIIHIELCKEEIVAIFAFALGGREELAAFATIYLLRTFYNSASRNLSVSFLKSMYLAIEQGCTNKAKIISLSVFIITTLLSLVELLLLSIIGSIIDKLFINEKQNIASTFRQYSVVYSGKIFLDNYLSLLSGMVRGLAKRRMLILLYLLGYYVLGIVLAIIMYFAKERSLYDVWLAFFISDLLVFLSGIVYILFLVGWNRRINFLRLHLIQEQTRDI